MEARGHDNCAFYDFSNLTDVDMEAFIYNQREQLFVGILMPIIMVLGIFSNVAFLVVYRCIRRMKTRTNIYLANLAVADALYVIFGVGEKVVALALSPIRYDSLRLSPVWCFTVLPFVKMCAYASMFFVTMVAVDKFVAVCHPFRVKRSSKRRYRLFLKPVRFVVAAWATAFACAITSIPALGKLVRFCVVWPSREGYSSRLPESFGICNPFYPWADGASNLFQISLYFFILFPNVFMYVKIVYTLHLRVKSAVRRDTQLRNYVARMLVINGSIFFLCTMPFYFFSLAYHVANFFGIPAWMEDTLKIVRPVAQALLYLNSGINPIIYNVANPRYRTAFSETFKCEKVRRQPGPTKTSDSTVLMKPVNRESHC